MAANSKRKFVIDCDVGTDDAQAVMMALVRPDLEVLAITAVFGNTSLKNTAHNALRVLKVCDALHVPVYAGCDRALLGSPSAECGFHGIDGLGDITDLEAPDRDLIRKEHATLAMLRLVNENPGEITLVALGPLTNLAVALRLDQQFGSKLKDLYVMGGNISGNGNITATAEFNFFSDPEAASVVLAEWGQLITLVDLDICCECYWSWGWYEKLTQIPTAKARFVKAIDRHTVGLMQSRGDPRYGAWDQLAMAVAINANVAMATEDVYMQVECQGHLSRGQCVVDRRREIMSGKAANVRLLTKVDKELYGKLIIEALEK